MSDHAPALDPSSSAHGNPHAAHHGPKNPVRLYIITLSALLFLTFLTVLVAQFDLGNANIAAALGIATLKASLVVLLFMHLLHDKPMNGVIFVSALVFLSLLLGFTFLDSTTRIMLIPANDKPPAGGDFLRPANLGVPTNVKRAKVPPAGSAGAAPTSTPAAAAAGGAAPVSTPPAATAAPGATPKTAPPAAAPPKK